MNDSQISNASDFSQNVTTSYGDIYESSVLFFVHFFNAMFLLLFMQTWVKSKFKRPELVTTRAFKVSQNYSFNTH